MLALGGKNVWASDSDEYPVEVQDEGTVVGAMCAVLVVAMH